LLIAGGNGLRLAGAGGPGWNLNAIQQYLALQRPEAGLLPGDERARLDVTRWQFWDLAHWDSACAALSDLVDPGHLDRFQDLFARALRVVVKPGKLADPAVQVGKPDGFGIDRRKALGELLRDQVCIGPFHRDSPPINAFP
jgi:hypothetical protein